MYTCPTVPLFIRSRRDMGRTVFTSLQVPLAAVRFLAVDMSLCAAVTKPGCGQLSRSMWALTTVTKLMVHGGRFDGAQCFRQHTHPVDPEAFSTFALRPALWSALDHFSKGMRLREVEFHGCTFVDPLCDVWIIQMPPKMAGAVVRFTNCNFITLDSEDIYAGLPVHVTTTSSVATALACTVVNNGCTTRPRSETTDRVLRTSVRDRLAAIVHRDPCCGRSVSEWMTRSTKKLTHVEQGGWPCGSLVHMFRAASTVTTRDLWWAQAIPPTPVHARVEELVRTLCALRHVSGSDPYSVADAIIAPFVAILAVMQALEAECAASDPHADLAQYLDQWRARAHSLAGLEYALASNSQRVTTDDLRELLSDDRALILLFSPCLRSI
jgi:hypothetical protein